MKEFIALRWIACTASKKEKMQILKDNGTEDMKTIMYLVFNKFLTYRIQQIDLPETYNTVQPEIVKPLEVLLLDLAKHQTGSLEAKKMIKQLLSRCTEEVAEWVVKIIKKDIAIGIDEKSVNKVFPGLIPMFDVQLALKVDDINTLRYPIVVEPKLDGVRCLAIVKDMEVKFYSREGREFSGLECIGEEILKLRPGTNFVLDGEILAKKFNPKNKTSVKNKDGNWKFSQSLSMLKNQDTSYADTKEFQGYFVWDVIDYDYFLTQGAKGTAKVLTDRKFELEALFTRTKNVFENLFVVPNAVALTPMDVMKYFRTLRDQGEEGIMIKNPDSLYEFKRSSAVLKMKEFFTHDLRIIGCKEGTGKYVGKLGALVLQDDTGKIKTDVGSGFSDDDRMELWLRYLAGELKGTIHEICYQEETADGSLRFPTWVRERTDKTTTSLN